MNKELVLQIIKLLSSFETALLVSKTQAPDHVWKQQEDIMNKLTAIVLGEKN